MNLFTLINSYISYETITKFYLNSFPNAICLLHLPDNIFLIQAILTTFSTYNYLLLFNLFI
jgi:hypothetical protein